MAKLTKVDNSAYSLNSLFLENGFTLFEPWSVKRGLNAFPKGIGPCLSAQFAQTDMGRCFLLS